MNTRDASATSTPPQGFWKLRHAVIGLGVLALLVMLVMRGCGGDDEPSKQAKQQKSDMPHQAIVVQIPASQWPARQAPASQQPPAYGYQPPPAQAPAPAVNSGNPWATQTRPNYGYGQSNYQQWGPPQPQPPPQYAQTLPGASRYRPLDGDKTQSAPPRPVQQPAQSYYPVAPYDRPGGSSFDRQAYPYGGAYPGYYGGYGAPGPGYGYPPVYPGAVPPGGWAPMW